MDMKATANYKPIYTFDQVCISRNQFKIFFRNYKRKKKIYCKIKFVDMWELKQINK